MQRLLSVVALASIVAGAGAPLRLLAATGASKTNSPEKENAPADQYFGKLKMSPIRIRLRIDDLGVRYAKRTEDDDDLLHDAGIVESSMDAWLAKYPHDVWGAPTAFHLAQLYTEIQTQTARDKARDLYTFVSSKYASSSEGHLARLRLAQGFPELHAETALVATPAPMAAATSTASSAPATQVTATPVGPAPTVPNAGSSAAPGTPAPVATAAR